MEGSSMDLRICPANIPAYLPLR